VAVACDVALALDEDVEVAWEFAEEVAWDVAVAPELPLDVAVAAAFAWALACALISTLGCSTTLLVVVPVVALALACRHTNRQQGTSQSLGGTSSPLNMAWHGMLWDNTDSVYTV
jgi:hypothetical protein